MRARLVHTAVTCWEIPDSCTDVTNFEVKQYMPGLTIRGHGAAPNDRGAAAVDKRNETFLRAGSYY